MRRPSIIPTITWNKLSPEQKLYVIMRIKYAKTKRKALERLAKLTQVIEEPDQNKARVHIEKLLKVLDEFDALDTECQARFEKILVK